MKKMNNDEKSIAYAFISNGVQIYTGKDEYFIVSKLICKDCGDGWYMNLTECFLCGVINPFLYRCSKCQTFQSITKSNNICNKCGSEELFMVCPNKDCLSNKNKELFIESNKFGGIFNHDSGLMTSQHYCLNCGSEYHQYKNFKIYVRVIDNDEFNFNELLIKKENISENSYLILKHHTGKSLKYGLYSLKDIIDKKIKIDNLKDNFSIIVSQLYPIKS